MADTAGFGLSQIFQDTDSGCLDLTMQISGAAMKQSCTVGPVRIIGQATELNFSCVGTQGMVVGTMGALNRTLLSFTP